MLLNEKNKHVRSMGHDMATVTQHISKNSLKTRGYKNKHLPEFFNILNFNLCVEHTKLNLHM